MRGRQARYAASEKGRAAKYAYEVRTRRNPLAGKTFGQRIEVPGRGLLWLTRAELS